MDQHLDRLQRRIDELERQGENLACMAEDLHQVIGELRKDRADELRRERAEKCPTLPGLSPTDDGPLPTDADGEELAGVAALERRIKELEGEREKTAAAMHAKAELVSGLRRRMAEQDGIIDQLRKSLSVPLDDNVALALRRSVETVVAERDELTRANSELRTLNSELSSAMRRASAELGTLSRPSSSRCLRAQHCLDQALAATDHGPLTTDVAAPVAAE